MKIKVVAIEDHPLMLRAVVDELNLQDDIEVVGTADHGSKLHQIVRTTNPDVVVLDLGMAEGVFEPVTAVRQLKKEHPKVQVLILTGYDDELYMRELTGAGAMGYVLKSDNLSLQLTKAVRAIHRGEPFYSPTVLKKILLDQDENAFTDQELAVLRLTAQGLVNGKIGDALGLSEGRIRNILTNIYAKMGVQDDKDLNPRVVIVIKARELGLLPEGG